ncbi:hypothetical protein D3C87_1739270 [compost metagenome]
MVRVIGPQVSQTGRASAPMMASFKVASYILVPRYHHEKSCGLGDGWGVVGGAGSLAYFSGCLSRSSAAAMGRVAQVQASR